MKCNWSAFADFLYPREGTETSAASSSVSSSVIFFIPARGRKLVIPRHVTGRVSIFFIPARGRKRCIDPLSVLTFGFSLSPRGDGNHTGDMIGGISWRDFLYPREGTETCGAKSRGTAYSGFPLSPRGDGNMSRREYKMIKRRIFFIPARGRKQQVDAIINGVFGVSLSPRGDGNSAAALLVSLSPDFLYPREGTETTECRNAPSAYLIFFIPARGRKQWILARRFVGVKDFLYPREGTETLRSPPRGPAPPDFLYPREGTETSFSASPNRIMQ